MHWERKQQKLGAWNAPKSSVNNRNAHAQHKMSHKFLRFDFTPDIK